MKDFAVSEWNRAWRTLNSGKLLLKTDPDSSVSRAYYASFHGLTAYFALREMTFSKHTAIRSALHKELICTKLLKADIGQAYDFLMDLREVGDYGGINKVSEENAEMALEKSEAILNSIKEISTELSAIPLENS